MSDKIDSVEFYEERLFANKLLIFKRNGRFHARVYIGNRKYLSRTLKTDDINVARDAATSLYHKVQYQQENQIPVQPKKFSTIIDEYIKHRERQHANQPVKSPHSKKGEYTSAAMLRQIKRVSKFWREYCGHIAIEKIDNAILKDFVPWRSNYYQRMPANKIPRNAKLNPAPKTLEWETTFALQLIKYAHDRGYRGALALPDYRYKASRITTRPAFSDAEYRQLSLAIIKWRPGGTPEHSDYMKLLLMFYVLILVNSGIRIGEANSLRESDVDKVTDKDGAKGYRLRVTGKTGKREVVLHATAVLWMEQLLKQNANMKPHWDAMAASPSKRYRRKHAVQGDWLFRMYDGNQVITLIDQFKSVLKAANLTHSSKGEPFTLYSLRHTYAVNMLRKGTDVFAIARNMGTGVDVIERYYGKHATAPALAGRLGGWAPKFPRK